MRLDRLQPAIKSEEEEEEEEPPQHRIQVYVHALPTAVTAF